MWWPGRLLEPVSNAEATEAEENEEAAAKNEVFGSSGEGGDIEEITKNPSGRKQRSGGTSGDSIKAPAGNEAEVDATDARFSCHDEGFLLSLNIRWTVRTSLLRHMTIPQTMEAIGKS